MEKLHVPAYSAYLQVLTIMICLNPEGRPTPRRGQKFRRIRRRYYTNQSRNPPNIGAYKIPHLQSQFPPNPTSTQPERSTTTYLQIH